MAEFETVRQLIFEASLLARYARSSAITADKSGGLGVGERMVMRLLGMEEGMTVPELARVGVTTRQNVRVVVNRLVAKGLARQTVNPAHRKSPLIQISEDGRKRLARSEDSLERQLQGKIGTLDDGELAFAIECLRRTRELIYGDAGLVTKAQANESLEESRTGKTAGNNRKHSAAKEKPDAEENEAELPVNLL